MEYHATIANLGYFAMDEEVACQRWRARKQGEEVVLVPEGMLVLGSHPLLAVPPSMLCGENATKLIS